MNLHLNINYEQTDYTEKENKLITDLFGIPTKSVSFKLKVYEKIDEKHKFINFFGISGSGKTVIKNAIKEILLNDNKTVLDFDDLSDFEEKYNDISILELFDVQNSNDEILKILGSFGLFEIRLLLSKIKLLSNGQKTRLKYIWLFHNISVTDTTHILIDEFLTFVDEVTSINFSRSIVKYLDNKNIKLYTFGVNSKLAGQFEDISYQLGSSSINSIVENGKITYK